MADNSQEVFSRHKGFFSLLFVLLSLAFLVVTYTAIQQQKVFKSKAATTVKLTVNGAGLGSGIVKTLNNNNINCQIDAGQTSGVCSFDMQVGGVGVLTASASAGSSFGNWAGCTSSAGKSCVLTNMQKDTAVTATFQKGGGVTPSPSVSPSPKPSPTTPPNTVKLTVKGSGTGAGVVKTINTDRINCRINAGQESGDCTQNLRKGADFHLSANDAVGSKFVRWLNCGSTTTNRCSMTNVTTDKTVTAVFRKISNGPTATPTPGGGGGTGGIAVNLKLKFQGIVNKPKDEKTVSVKVTLATPTSRTQPKTVEMTVNANGVWSGSTTFANAKERTDYMVLVKGPFHVQKRVCDAKPAETASGTYRCATGKIALKLGQNSLDFSGIVMLVGDLPNQDGVVDSYDISLIRNIVALPSNERTSQKNLAVADLNLDGIVDSQDYSLVIASLSVKYDEQ